MTTTSRPRPVPPSRADTQLSTRDPEAVKQLPSVFEVVNNGHANRRLGYTSAYTRPMGDGAKLRAGYSHAVVNEHETVTGDFTRNPDFTLPGATRFGLLRDPVRLSDYHGKTIILALFPKARTKG